MTANKVPKMPEAYALECVSVRTDDGLYVKEIHAIPLNRLTAGYQKDKQYLYTADQMRAMYLAGIADAKEAVPADAVPVDMEGPYTITHGAAVLTVEFQAAQGYRLCRETALANLSALEQGVGK